MAKQALFYTTVAIVAGYAVLTLLGVAADGYAGLGAVLAGGR